MKKLIHSIHLNVYEKNEENIDTLKSILLSLLPIDTEKDKIEIKHEKLEGFQQKTIHSLTLTTSKQRHHQLLLDQLFTNISKNEIIQLKNQIESRLNDEGFFYIRLDKQSFLNKKYTLTDSGDCFHIKIKLAAYPAKRTTFIETIKSILENYE